MACAFIAKNHNHTVQHKILYTHRKKALKRTLPDIRHTHIYAIEY